MIENIGSGFGTAFVAIVVATVTNRISMQSEQAIIGYHAGLLVSSIALMVRFIFASFLKWKYNTSN